MSAAPITSSPVSHDALTQRRARNAARLLFLILGAIAGTWGAHVPSVKAHHGLDEAALSVLLLVAAAGTVSSMMFAGRCVGRLGVRRTAAMAAPGACLSLGASLQAPAFGWLLALMLIFGASMSMLDVAINTAGSELETLGGRRIMSQLHGMFSVGGLCGAGLAAWLLSAQVAATVQLPGVCALMALAALLACPRMQNGAFPDPVTQAHFTWPRGTLLVIGLLIFVGMTAEGVMADWSVLYLKQELGMTAAQAAMGYAVFCGAMAVSRFAGDALRERFAETTLLGCGASVAGLGMAWVLISAQPWVAWIGFALAGAGLAPVAPILFQAATRVPGVSPAAAIAAVTSIGYSGFMLGPPVMGAIATMSSLTTAMGVVVVAAGILAFCARWVPVPR
jgi:fucose permease